MTLRLVFSGTLALAASLMVCTAHAQTLTDAGQYDLFTLGSASNSNVDVLGKVAIGGNANFTDYTLGSNSPTGSAVNVVVGGNFSDIYANINGSVDVGGTFTYTNPTVFGNVAANGAVNLSNYGEITGNVTYGTTLSNPTTTVFGVQSSGTTTLPINFATASTNLISESATLAALPTTGTITSDGFGHLTASSTGSLEVYDLPAAGLSSDYGLNITASPGATVIVNVTGVGNGTVTLPNQHSFVSVNGTSANNVLFNFGDATSSSQIDLSGFDTNILAPKTTVQGSSGDFHGSLMVQTFNGNGLELHNDILFTGNVPKPKSAVPEPTAWVLVLSGVGGLAGVGRVGRRR